MSVSPTTFRYAFNRFQAIHELEAGKPLDGLSELGSRAYEWEDKKRNSSSGARSPFGQRQKR